MLQDRWIKIRINDFPHKRLCIFYIQIRWRGDRLLGFAGNQKKNRKVIFIEKITETQNIQICHFRVYFSAFCFVPHLVAWSTGGISVYSFRVAGFFAENNLRNNFDFVNGLSWSCSS